MTFGIVPGIWTFQDCFGVNGGWGREVKIGREWSEEALGRSGRGSAGRAKVRVWSRVVRRVLVCILMVLDFGFWFRARELRVKESRLKCGIQRSI